jgi:hypothetical protein
MQLATSGDGNTAVGAAAMGVSAVTGGYNTAIGITAGPSLTSGSFNTFIGQSSGTNLLTGSSNIAIGAGSTISASNASNQLSIGSAARYVGTNTNATDYFPTATTGAVALGLAFGFIRIYLNGSFVKIPVYGN